MVKILFWGGGKAFSYVLSFFLQDKIKIVGIIDKNKKEVEGIPVFAPDEIDSIEFDFLMISSLDYIEEIRKEAIYLGVDSQKILTPYMTHRQHIKVYNILSQQGIASITFLNQEKAFLEQEKEYKEFNYKKIAHRLERTENIIKSFASSIVSEKMARMIEPVELWLAVSINPHCNLNCAGCNAFAPLAKEEYLDIEEYRNDMCRLSELSNKQAHVIQIMGGEPLINPKSIEYAKIARYFFPRARISFVTNGLLLKKQSELFYSECIENNIAFDITPYPIDFDYDSVIKFLEEKGIEWKYQDGKNVKIFRKEPFDLKPDIPCNMAAKNWIDCYMANNCVMLSHGRISCTRICNANIFMDAFPVQTNSMYFSEDDFIDIYKVEGIDEIFRFIAKPKPFCKFCDVHSRKDVEYYHSSKSISEWV